MNKLLIGLVVLSLVLSVLAFTRPGQVIVRELGSAAGTLHTQTEAFLTGLSTTGFVDFDTSIPTISGVSTVTVTAAQICSNEILNLGFNVATGTVTLPTPANFKSGGQCLVGLGDSKTFAIYNSTSSGNVGFAMGASSSLFTHILASTTSVLAGDQLATSSLRSKGLGEFRVYRLTSSSEEWLIYELDTYK